MHTIKFRGKSLSTGELVYGSLLHGENIVLPSGKAYPVDPKTVGQYLKVKDSLKNEVYEGDIISMNYEYKYSNGYEGEYEIDEDIGRYIGVVGLVSSQGIVLKNPIRESELKDTIEKIKGYKFFRSYISQIIGNIYNN